MTIAIGLKVGDGIVLGADSAWTIVGSGGIDNVYFNAEKVVNLVKGLPIGAVVYGLGSFGGRSITRYAKDLRARLCGAEPGYADWALDPHGYTMELVAKRLRGFFYDELYLPAYSDGQTQHQDIGFIIGGHSAGQRSGELWQVQITGGACGPPVCVWGPGNPDGILFGGQTDALYRLVRGWSNQLVSDLVAATKQPTDAVIAQLDRIAPLFRAEMPIQDAIDFVRYLVDVTAGFVRFSPGWPTVAPPIDLAAITLHEGFRWVQRKHYYDASLNPPPTPEETRYDRRKERPGPIGSGGGPEAAGPGTTTGTNGEGNDISGPTAKDLPSDKQGDP